MFWKFREIISAFEHSVPRIGSTTSGNLLTARRSYRATFPEMISVCWNTWFIAVATIDTRPIRLDTCVRRE